ncbi:MAG TPA: hypothetical protein DEB05_11145 [Firmicutes bacterium]|jgi:uncharacterized integral membrane protein|nr:hypothetical protein [Bacillota bacterium]HBT17496.1 hypothetical protein [Bacillota bacterium]
MQALFLVALIFAVLVAVFALQNAYPVTIYFLRWQFEASLGLVILFSLLIGAVSLGGFGLLHQAKTKFRKPRGKGEKRQAEQADIVDSDENEVGEEKPLLNPEVADRGGEKDFLKKLED